VAENEHIERLNAGRSAWNEWRDREPEVRADLSGHSIFDGNCRFLNLRGADLRGFQARSTHFAKSDFTGADLDGADFLASWFQDCDFRGAKARRANFGSCLLRDADFTAADLTSANFSEARLIRSDFTDAVLNECHVYGVSVWDVVLEGAEQKDLVVTGSNAPDITVDRLELAQFVHLLLNNASLANVIQTVTSKVVLILGSFAQDRIGALRAMRTRLREDYDLLPVLFDFEGPANQDLVRTVVTIANLARFIIADITNPRAVPQELQAIVTAVAIPVRPIMQSGSEPPTGVFKSFLTSNERILKVFRYEDLDGLLGSFDDVLAPVEARIRELHAERTRELFEN
jgi:uncharacterized protein YjbI with pentapeptide repeats